MIDYNGYKSCSKHSVISQQSESVMVGGTGPSDSVQYSDFSFPG
jgi:hypothetical protein